jgi:hypothetical protein
VEKCAGGGRGVRKLDAAPREAAGCHDGLEKCCCTVDL